MLEINDIKKSFGDIVALDGLSFKAKDGEITGFLGPNGAGKTTCLRTIYGLLKPDVGYCKVDGIDVRDNPLEVRKNLGIFPDKFGLYERLTAFEQIEYFAGLHGLAGEEKNTAINKVITDLQMQDIAHRKTMGFSQGQRMKVILAQALVHQPQNFVLLLKY